MPNKFFLFVYGLKSKFVFFCPFKSFFNKKNFLLPNFFVGLKSIFFCGCRKSCTITCVYCIYLKTEFLREDEMRFYYDYLKLLYLFIDLF